MTILQDLRFPVLKKLQSCRIYAIRTKKSYNPAGFAFSGFKKAPILQDLCHPDEKSYNPAGLELSRFEKAPCMSTRSFPVLKMVQPPEGDGIGAPIEKNCAFAG
jgi:hypothetical protein